MCVIAAMFSISCMPLVNWLAGVWVCVCMGVRAGKVVLCIPLSSCSLHIWDPSQSGGAGPWVLEKPKVTQERKGCRPGETGQGWMRRIVSQRRRITLQEDVVCLLHRLPPTWRVLCLVPSNTRTTVCFFTPTASFTYLMFPTLLMQLIWSLCHILLDSMQDLFHIKHYCPHLPFTMLYF